MADHVLNPIDGPKQFSSSKRSRRLCHQCRQDKHKCVPADRDWDGEQERCLRCIKLGHPCGPSETKPRRWSQNAPALSSSSTFDIAGNLQTHFASAASDGSTASNSLPPPIASYPARVSVHSVSLEADAGSCHTRQTAQASNKISQPLTMTGRKHHERECRKLLKSLGDMKALRKNVLFDIETVNELEQRLGLSLSFHTHRSRLRAVISAIDTDSVCLFNSGVALIPEDMGSHKEYFLSRLSSLMEDFRNRSRVYAMSVKHDQHALDETVRLNLTIQNAVYQSHKKKEAFSEAESICNALGEEPRFSRCPMLGSDCEATAAYIRAAADLEHVFEQLTFEDMDYPEALLVPNSSPVPIQRRYPAPQLAYRTHDMRMAMKLWDTSTGSRQEVDALHRSLLHYAVNADDVQSVQHIARASPHIIKTTGVDIFGMSLLALAAVRSNTNMFNLLLREDAPWFTFDKEGRSVLALAARSGNIDIVRRMLTLRPYPTPLCMALRLAIEGLHEGPARLILACFREPACYDEIGLEGAGELADRKGLYSLAIDIRNTKPFFGTASGALQDVDEANFEDLARMSNSQMPPSFGVIDWTQSAAAMLADTATFSQGKHVFTPQQSTPYAAPAHMFATPQHHQWQVFHPSPSNQYRHSFE